MTTPVTFTVIEAWTRSYMPALAVTAGEPVLPGKTDDDWPGWVWCRNAVGLGGWLPAALLSCDQAEKGAVLKADFNTVELSVTPGEELEGFQDRDGWVWCRNQAGAEGWVPLACVVAKREST